MHCRCNPDNTPDDIITKIVARPAMYVGKSDDIYAIWHFLNGYSLGSKSPELKEFFFWLRDHREQIEGPSTQGWPTWLLNQTGGDRKMAVQLLGQLYAKFQSTNH